MDMARKFALYLKDGHEVRNNIEEITDYFDYSKIVEYFHDGSLRQWLDDRHYEAESIALSALDANTSDFKKKLCYIFHVDENTVDDEKIIADELVIKKLEIVRQYTTDKHISDNIAKVATNQDELNELVENKEKEIYLCASSFVIPLDIENITYIGIGNPVAVIKSDKMIDFEAKKIFFCDINFDDEYNNICEYDNNDIKERLKKPETLAEMLGVIINGELKNGTFLWKTAGDNAIKKDNFFYSVWLPEKIKEIFPVYENDCNVIGGAKESHLAFLDTEYLLFTDEYMLIRDAQGRIKIIRYNELNNVYVEGLVFDDLKYELKYGKIEELHNSTTWDLKVGLKSIRLFLLLAAKILGSCDYTFTSEEMSKLSKVKLESLNGGNIIDYL